MTLNIKAETEAEKRVKAYLEENASDVLAEKINGGKKTLEGFFRYAKDQARAKAVNGCACIDDKTVFGWAIHYFEEDAVKEESGEPKAETPAAERKAAKIEASKPASKTVTAEKEPKKKDKQADGQLDLFSLIGGEA